MVLLIIIPIKWLFVWEYTLFSDKPICSLIFVAEAAENLGPFGPAVDLQPRWLPPLVVG